MLIGVIAEELLLPSAIAEVVVAGGATSTETAIVILTVLLNEPASASDAIYIGEFLVEAANAAAAVNAGYGHAGIIVEAATADSLQNAFAAAAGVVTGAVDETATAAVSVQDAATGFAAAIAEAATAASSEDGAVAVALATYDGLATNVVVSNGGLTVLHNVTSSNCGAISTAFESSGKYYFEVKLENSTAASNYLGIMASTWASVFTTTEMTANSTSIQLGGTGNIISNGGVTGKTIGAQAVGDVYSCAMDLTGHLGWFRKNGGNWNGDASANPATGTGGVTITAGSFAPIVRFALAGSTTNQMTGNFGQSAFVYTAPSGFGNWPA